ncbi:MAG TPA: PAS domain-containing sensor histidine kinase, partial [Cytophagales bacterium]|nr:PAS domain-containing sensor histidine kinase [Cytophagales bacterium]
KNQVKLEAKNVELEQFTYIASHDLLEPLRTVSNYIQILDEDYGAQLDEQGKNYLKTIDNASKRMQTLVRALLDYSRLGRVKEKVPIDCRKIIQDAISDLQNLIVATKTKIEITDDTLMINGFETELRQLFQNLINNAIKFTKSDRLPQIKIESKKINDHWHFSVSDNGIGIETKNFNRIFNIFQQLNPTDKYEGYGIGLANCKKIVELHNGTIWVTSQLGIGTTFHFTILSI